MQAAVVSRVNGVCLIGGLLPWALMVCRIQTWAKRHSLRAAPASEDAIRHRDGMHRSGWKEPQAVVSILLVLPCGQLNLRGEQLNRGSASPLPSA